MEFDGKKFLDSAQEPDYFVYLVTGWETGKPQRPVVATGSESECGMLEPRKLRVAYRSMRDIACRMVAGGPCGR